jgi:hypothetical protein
MSWINNQQVRRCPSSLCERPFQVNRFSTRLSPSMELGQMTCPHCGVLLDGENNSVFLTHALSASQEAEYNKTGPQSEMPGPRQGA